jgi:hypothetical protein
VHILDAFISTSLASKGAQNAPNEMTLHFILLDQNLGGVRLCKFFSFTNQARQFVKFPCDHGVSKS